ncbi:MAG: MaoC family dehydratase N-terminal domain-containing protein [Actinomycetales bacterium]|nr:MaoC family dehydratase N-terminal domain-containing protein [Actinomycetales bacterium]
MAPLTVGQEVPEHVIHLRRADLRDYAAASGDRNPIHLDDDVAAEVGLPGVIAHGMLTMGHAARIVSDAAGGAWTLRSISVRFTRPVVVPPQHDDPGYAELRIRAKVTAVDETTGEATIAITATFNGQTVLARAEARAVPA